MAGKKQTRVQLHFDLYPEWLDPEIWAEFIQFRTEIKKPLFEIGEKRMISKLARLSVNCDYRDILDRSIINNWQDIYELPDEDNTQLIDSIPYDSIAALYERLLPNNPPIFKLNELRKAQIRARWKNDADSLKQWENYFDMVADSKFLTGRVTPGKGRTKPFYADIDFLIDETNMLKIAEGKYDD